MSAPVRDAPPRPDWVPDALYPFEDRYRDIAGNLVHYVDEGEGPTVLMVHGNPDWSFLYRDVIIGLRDRFRCVALDFPGFGLSTARPGYAFTPGEHAEVLVGLIETLDLSEVTIMVQDWGGPLGLAAAARLRPRVRALVIGSTLAWPDYARSTPWWVRLMMNHFIGSERARRGVLAQNRVVEGFVRHGGNIGPRKMTPEVARAYLGRFTTPGSRLPTWVFAHHLFAGRGEHFLAEVERGLAALRELPVLFVWGTHDRYCTIQRDLARFEAHFPEHRRVVLEGVGHWYQEVAPEQTVAAIREWWAECIDGRPPAGVRGRVAFERPEVG